MIVKSFDSFCAVVDLADDGSFLVRFAEATRHVCRCQADEEVSYKEVDPHEHWSAHDRIIICKDGDDLAHAFERAKAACLKIRELLAEGRLPHDGD